MARTKAKPDTAIAGPRTPDTRLTARQWGIFGALLGVAAVLAVTSLWQDSITYDETSHLTAGYSNLVTGDYRLAPDHPPLAKMWCAAPLLALGTKWLPADAPAWRIGDPFFVGREYLFALNNGPVLVLFGRCMMVVLMLGVMATVFAIGRRLFGVRAALAAMALAALSPTLLAHGRLVTTDVPVTLCISLSILLFARVLERVTWGRLVAAGVALGAASVAKLSWPLVLPALALMAVWALVRRAPLVAPAFGFLRGKAAAGANEQNLAARHQRLAALALASVTIALLTWVCLWTTYRWRASVFPDAADGTLDDGSEFLAGPIGVAWHDALFDESGAARGGLLPTVLRLAQDYRLLPDSYLLGLAWTMQSTSGRSAYFCGEVSDEGWPSYFPVALAIKTPMALLLLVLAGVGALVLRRARPRDGMLLLGLLSFAAIHFAYVCSSHLNIGQRHLLPIYPVLFVLGGAAVAWCTSRIGRGLVAAAFVWLIAANAFIYPNYLSYFNESIGGPARGHLYLADSNIDWGQDLERLRAFMDAHGDETIKLSYFGSAVPEAYGFDGSLLPSSIDTGSAEYLDGGGTYVISVTELLGVYVGRARNHFWRDPAKRESYRQFVAWMEQPEAELSAEEIAKRAQASDEFARARWGRFLYELRKRPPNERIGWSMFVYRLSSDDIVALTRP